MSSRCLSSTCIKGNCQGCKNGVKYCNDPRCYPNCPDCEGETTLKCCDRRDGWDWILIVIIAILALILLALLAFSIWSDCDEPESDQLLNYENTTYYYPTEVNNPYHHHNVRQPVNQQINHNMRQPPVNQPMNAAPPNSYNNRAPYMNFDKGLDSDLGNVQQFDNVINAPSRAYLDPRNVRVQAGQSNIQPSTPDNRITGF